MAQDERERMETTLYAERALLGGVIRYPERAADVIRLVTEDHFAHDNHRRLWVSFVGLWQSGQVVDLVALADDLKRRGWIEDIGGYGALSDLVEAGGINLEHYATIVRNHYLLRRLVLAGGEIQRDARDPAGSAEEVLGEAERKILELAEIGVNGDAVPLSEAVNEAYDALDARQRHGDGVRGVPTGFRDLDALLAGLQDSELVILAARPSVGKSAGAVAIVRHLAVDLGIPVLFASLEQSRLELAERLLCAQGSVDSHHLRRGILAGDEVHSLSEAGEQLRAAPLYIDDQAAQTTLRIAAQTRRYRTRKGVRLLVVDYLQLIQPDNRKAPRQEQVASISRQLKLIARENKIPVLALAQVNRESENRTDGRPRLSDLRESGSLEQDADTVILMHRPGNQQPDAPVSLIEFIVAKQRNGPTGEVTLAYRKQYMRFEDYQAGGPFDGSAA